MCKWTSENGSTTTVLFASLWLMPKFCLPGFCLGYEATWELGLVNCVLGGLYAFCCMGEVWVQCSESSRLDPVRWWYMSKNRYMSQS